MESKEKRTWVGDNAYPNIRSKRRKLTHLEIIDCIAEQTASVIIQMRKESKLRIYRTYGGHVSYSFKFTYKCYIRLAFHNSYKRYSLD